MKKIWLFILIIQLAAPPAFPAAGGDRIWFYLISGIGYASSHPEGFLAEAGIEVRLFGNIHTRILLEHYPGREIRKDSVTLKHMYSIDVYAVYKLQVSETIDFRVKIGGHYSSARAEITALGITFTTTMADIGYSGGGGFSWQLGNRVYLYAEAAVKHLLLDDPWTWVKGEIGLMFRLR
jgi:hypothetical protein